MSTLGFSGAGGVGRPFTIQDLFSAVSGAGTSSTNASTAQNVINQYLDEVDQVVIVDVFVTSSMSPVVYDNGVWEDGSWT